MEDRIKTVGLIGLGAMGSFFAPRLQRALGNDFFVIAEGARKERLEKNGIKVRDERFYFNIRTPEEGSPTDLLIISTKGYSLDAAIKDIERFVGEDTLILCVINGVEGEEKVIASYGAEKVLYSYMRVSIMMQNGCSSYDLYSTPAPGAGVHFGEARNTEGQYSERVQRIKELFDRTGVPCFIDEDMLFGIWFKFACNISENLTCALLGIPFGTLISNKDSDALRKKSFMEIAAIAEHVGVHITEEIFDKQRATLEKIPYENKPSTLQDIEAGKKTEIEMFAGTAIRLGKKYGVPTPVCEVYYHGIKVLEAKNE